LTTHIQQVEEVRFCLHFPYKHYLHYLKIGHIYFFSSPTYFIFILKLIVWINKNAEGKINSYKCNDVCWLKLLLQIKSSWKPSADYVFLTEKLSIKNGFLPLISYILSRYNDYTSSCIFLYIHANYSLMTI